MHTVQPEMTAHLISQLPAGTHGPLMVRLLRRRFVVWSEPTEGHRAWRLLEVPQGGEPETVTDSGPELSTTAVRPLAGLGRIWISWTEPEPSGGEVLFSLLVDPENLQVARAVRLTESKGNAIVWMDAFETATGTVVLWAVSEGERAGLFGVGLDASGRPRGDAMQLFDEVRAWQAVVTKGELAVLVTRVLRGRALGPVELAYVGTERLTVDHTTLIEPQPIGESNVDLLPIATGLLVAYVERSLYQSRVMTAVVDERRALVAPPVPLGPALGDQSLVRLVQGPTAERPAIVWENLTEPTPRRTLALSFLDRLGRLVGPTRRFRCRPDVDQLPEFAATERGIAILTMDDELLLESSGEDKRVPATDPKAPADTPAQRSLGDRESSRMWGPTLLEFDVRGDLIGVTPLAVSTGHDQRWLAWGLDCQARCHALAAHGTESAEVFIADFSRAPKMGPANPSLVERLVVAEPESRQVRLTEYQTLETVMPLADLAVRRRGADTLLAFMTEFDPKTPLVRLATPGEDGRTDPLRARLELRLWKAGVPLAPLPPVVSLRARSAGGVELAWSKSGQDALLVWTAEDAANIPQVFVTRVDTKGRKLGQRMLTRKRGELGEVSVIATDDGWLVAWTDERSGKREIYATALTRELERRGEERRLTPDARLAGEMALFARGSTVSILYGDARDPEDPGRTEIFMKNVGSRDAAPIGEEIELFSSPHTAHSLRVTAFGTDAAVVTFLEDEAALGAQGLARRLRFGVLKGDGGLLRTVETVPGGKGRIATYGVDCQDAGCLLVMRTHDGDEGWLEASLAQPGEDHPMLTQALIGGLGPPLDVFPVVSGWSVFFVERGEANGNLIQRAELELVP